MMNIIDNIYRIKLYFVYFQILRLANTTAALVCRSKYGRFLGQNIIVNVRTIAIFGNYRECSEKMLMISLCRSCAGILQHPGKSFGWKFIPNQSGLFRNLFPRQSKLIRVNTKKVFNLVWCNSVKNQSVSIRVNPRLLFRMNPDQSVNPNDSEVRILRIDLD